ncbi:hypothetical protein ISCGN_015987 [Ixodes scapularis]
MPPQPRKPHLPPSKEPGQRNSARTDGQNWVTLRQHAACLQRQCPWMTAKKIYSELKCMSAKFRNDFFANCTQSATEPCFLAHKCDPWNRLLREIDMELSEREPGRDFELKKPTMDLLANAVVHHSALKTTTLKKATLSFRTTAESTRILLDAISRNQSLSKLRICDWTFEPWDLQQLYDILPLRKAIQSNLSTLHRAVLFVMGFRGREFAEAFERTCDLSSLVAAVQKSANQPEEQAKEMVKSSKRYLDCNFLAAVGVVRDVVVCVPNGRVQLDCIGLDNWLRIRLYLKVSDIKPQKRSRCN